MTVQLCWLNLIEIRQETRICLWKEKHFSFGSCTGGYATMYGLNCLFLCACSLKNTRSAAPLPLHTSHLTAICAMRLDSQNMHSLSVPITFKQCSSTYLDQEQNQDHCLWLKKPKIPLTPLPSSIEGPIFNALLPFLSQLIKLMHDCANASLDKQDIKKV